MIINSLEKKVRPRLKRPCSKCGKKFLPTGLSKQERLCESCFNKIRNKRRNKCRCGRMKIFTSKQCRICHGSKKYRGLNRMDRKK